MHEEVGLEHLYDEIDKAVDEGLPRPLPNTLLYRGVAEQAGELILNAPVGELITDQGFLSTTRINHAAVAEEPRSLEHPVLLVLHVPEGTQALSFAEDIPAYEWSHELEVAVQRHSTLVIIRKDMDQDIPLIDVVIAHQPDPLPALPEGAGDAAGLEGAIAKSRLRPLQLEVNGDE